MISIVLSTHDHNGHMAVVGHASSHEEAVKIAEDYRGRVRGKSFSTHSNMFASIRQAKKFVQARNRGLSEAEALKESQ